jgi:hypothetical protein
MSKNDAPAAEARSVLCTDATSKNCQYVSVNISMYQQCQQFTNSLFYIKLLCRTEKTFSIYQFSFLQDFQAGTANANSNNNVRQQLSMYQYVSV